MIGGDFNARTGRERGRVKEDRRMKKESQKIEKLMGRVKNYVNFWRSMGGIQGVPVSVEHGSRGER